LTETINDALRQSRQIIGNLRPHLLDDIGVLPAFRKLIGDFGKKFNIDVRFVHSDSPDIHPNQGITLFRILQEALHNIRKHAGASRVEVSLNMEKDGLLKLAVADNGKGFRPHTAVPWRRRSGMGLLIMRERAEDMGGSFTIQSEPGRGCTIRVSVSLDGGANER
jgi:signal transduction histidine kinase